MLTFNMVLRHENIDTRTVRVVRGESGRRRTRFRCEAEHHSVVIPNSIPV